mmetsp:Transcript_9225/g.56049  ORF Transcript_9225/g.56049 Transcript_9225/m.56049 type:complete len:245 (+) Transcript_9225:580-1314(+)
MGWRHIVARVGDRPGWTLQHVFVVHHPITRDSPDANGSPTMMNKSSAILNLIQEIPWDPFTAIVFTSWIVHVGVDDESCGRVDPIQTQGSSSDAIGVVVATRLHHKRYHNSGNAVVRDGGGAGIETPPSSDRSIQAVERSSSTGMEIRPHVVPVTPGCPGGKPTLEGHGARQSWPVSPSVTVDPSNETSARKTTHQRVGRCTAPAELRGKEKRVRTHASEEIAEKKRDGFELEHLGNVLGSEPR